MIIDFEIEAKAKGLHFSSVETSVCVTTDQILLERILRNLLTNALRYTPKGKILLGCRRLKHHIRIAVLDTGIGLSNEAKNKVIHHYIYLYAF